MGDRIRAVRRDRGLTLAKLSQLAGLSAGAISDMEQGRQKGTTKLPSLAAALGVRVEWLQTGQGAREGSGSIAEPTRSPYSHGWPNVTVEEARFGAEWGKLDEPARSQIQVMVESLVASQVRDKRKVKAKSAPKPADPSQRGQH